MLANKIGMTNTTGWGIKMKLIGHKKTKNLILTALAAANKRNMSLPHLLFAGAAGCGKTTLARELAKVAKVPFFTISPDDLSKSDDVKKKLDILSRDNYDIRGNRIDLIKPPIIFIDEIHRQALNGQEILGIAMEEFQIETGDENKYKWLPYFTVVGATTDDGKLSKPYRERFKIRILFEPYSFDESLEIIKFHAARLGLFITPKAVKEIAQRGRGIPRIMVGYLERIRDKCNICGIYTIKSQDVVKVFEDLEIDASGLTAVELKILKALYVSKDPIGQDNLAILVNESSKTLTYSVEPFLIQKGLMIRSGKGRRITEKGKEYIEENGYIGKEIKSKYLIEPGYIRK